jgi:hypothetical protein
VIEQELGDGDGLRLVERLLAFAIACVHQGRIRCRRGKGLTRVREQA